VNRQWVMFTQENGVDVQRILAHSNLCSRHFVPGRDYPVGAVNRRRLTRGAVPSVVSNNQHKTFDHCIEQLVPTYLQLKINSLGHYYTSQIRRHHILLCSFIIVSIYPGGSYLQLDTIPTKLQTNGYFYNKLY
jgi:hypothetical protein